MSLVPVLYKSQYLQPAADCGSIKLDASFEKFFTNLVVASLRPLRQVAMEAERAIEQLTVKQVVAWFEKDGKIRRELGTDAAFLDL
ncbi:MULTISPECIES: hypothetical protein [unclassified Microcoleus]